MGRRQGVWCGARGLGLALALLVAGTEGIAQERIEDFELEEVQLVPTLFSIDFGLAGIYDTNIDHDETQQETYGFKGDARVRLRSSSRRPLLRVDYRVDLQRFKDAPKWDRQTHNLAAYLEKRFGPLGLDAKGSAKFNAANEDREVGNRFAASPRLSLRTGDARLRVYGVYEDKRYSEDVEKGETIRGVGADIGGRGRAGSRVTVGYRYEEADSPDPERRFVRHRYSLEYRVNIGRRSVLWLEVEHRRRTFHERLFALEPELLVPTRDIRWVPAAWLRHRFRRGEEIRIEYEFQARLSNDPGRAFDAHQLTLSVRVPLLSPVRERVRGRL